MIFLDLASRVKVFIWSFISKRRFSIILRMSSGYAEGGFEDKDGFVIGYTHRGGGIIVVLKTEGFLER